MMKLIFKCVFLIGVCFSMSVDAYIPRSGFQVERIAQRRNDLKSAIVDSEVTLFEDNEPTSTRFYERSIVDYTSRKYQSVATQSSGTSIFEISRQLEPQSAKHPALMSLLFVIVKIINVIIN